MTGRDVATVVKLLDAAWPHQRTRPETFALLAQLLDGYELAPVEAVVRSFSLDGREFPPTPGMIVKRLDELARPAAIEWDQAQAEIITMIRRYGSYSQPPTDAWSDPLLARFMGMGARWREWCLSEEDDRTFRAQERNAFAAMAARAAQDRTLQLAGVTRTQIAGPRPAARAVAELVQQLAGDDA